MYARKNGMERTGRRDGTKRTLVKWMVASLAGASVATAGIAVASSADAPVLAAGVGGGLASGPTMSAGSRMSTDASVGDGEVWMLGSTSAITVASVGTGSTVTVGVTATVSVGVGGMSDLEAP